MVIMRVTTGANAWKKVKAGMGDRHISHKLKGNVLSLCVTPAYMNGQEI